MDEVTDHRDGENADTVNIDSDTMYTDFNKSEADLHTAAPVTYVSSCQGMLVHLICH
jgi:hypothetical protein